MHYYTYIYTFTYICHFASRWRYFCFLYVRGFFQKSKTWRLVSRKPFLMTANKKFASERIKWYAANGWIGGSFEINLYVPSISGYLPAKRGSGGITCRFHVTATTHPVVPVFARVFGTRGRTHTDVHACPDKQATLVLTRRWYLGRGVYVKEREERESQERHVRRRRTDGLYGTSVRN